MRRCLKSSLVKKSKHIIAFSLFTKRFNKSYLCSTRKNVILETSVHCFWLKGSVAILIKARGFLSLTWIKYNIKCLFVTIKAIYWGSHVLNFIGSDQNVAPYHLVVFYVMTPQRDFSLIGVGTITPKGSMNTANVEKTCYSLSEIMNNKQVLVNGLLESTNDLRSIFVGRIYF